MVDSRTSPIDRDLAAHFPRIDVKGYDVFAAGERELVRWRRDLEFYNRLAGRLMRAGRATAENVVLFEEALLLLEEVEWKLEAVRSWRREMQIPWQNHMERLEYRGRGGRVEAFLREREMLAAKDERLTVRSGELVSVTAKGRAYKPRRLDLWAELCRAVKLRYAPKRIERRALALYRRIMGRFPSREFVDDELPPDPRVVDLVDRERRWWMKNRSREGAGQS